MLKLAIDDEQYEYKQLCFNGNSSYLIDKFSTTYGIDSFYTEIAKFIANFLDDNDYLEVKTSGSTGTPKKYLVKKQYMLNSAKKTIKFLSLKEHDSALLCMPVNYIAGKMMVVRALAANLNLYIVKPCKNPYLNLNKNIVFSAITPMQAISALEYKQSYETMCKVEHTIIGGGSVDDNLVAHLQNASGQFYSSYGMTETLSHIALRVLNGTDKSPYYQCLDNVNISLSKQGTLIIDAFDVCDDTLITNDIAQIIDKQHFVILGRIDNVINSGGIKLQIEQIEQKLKPYLNCEFAICGVKDKLLGHKAVLVLTSKIDDNLLNQAFLGLDKYEKPKQIIYIQAIPYTKTQKIDRYSLYQLLNKS